MAEEGEGEAGRGVRPTARSWRVDAVLVVASCLGFGALASVAPLPALGVALPGLVFFASRLGRWEVLGAVAALLLGAFRASTTLDGFERERQRAFALVPSPSRCAVEGRVLHAPVLRTGVLHFDAELSLLDCDGRVLERPLIVRLSGGPSSLGRGDEFAGVANLAPVSSFRNFLLPDPRPLAAREQAVLRGSLLAVEQTRRGRGLFALIDRARASARERIEATFAEPVRGMARALVLGETDLSPEDSLAFRKSGLAHLLAVSGTHLVFAVLGVLRALGAVLRRIEPLAARGDVQRPVAILGLVLAPLYADFSGGSGSAWRAAFMLLAVLGSRALGRHVCSSRVIAASIVLGWLKDALAVFDPSFLLSLAATVGLSSFGRAFLEGSAPRVSATEPALTRASAGRVLARMTEGALTTLSATLPCVPLLLVLAPGLSLATVAANLLAAPLGEAVALPLCLTHALLGPLPSVERAVALVASGALALIREIARLTAGLDGLYFELPVPGCWHLATLALGVAGVVALRSGPWLGPALQQSALRRRCTLAWVGLVALVFAGVESSTVHAHSAARQRELGRLTVTALDVGQGDSTLIDLPDGRLVLIDGGGLPGSSLDLSARVLLPVLRARRRSHLDLVVLSHPHPDHFGGLLGLVDNISIGEFWYGGQTTDADRSGPVADLVRRLTARGVVVRTAAELCRGTPATRGYSIAVLHPCPEPAPAASANDNSLVLRIRFEGRAALFVGDAERWAEERLLEGPPGELGADFLKVGHHGSRSSSSPAFIARVQPEVASISAGLGNRFGHPHPETLATLAAAAVRVLRVDQQGSIEWQTDGEWQGVRAFAEAP